jgi:hypothetical protein
LASKEQTAGDELQLHYAYALQEASTLLPLLLLLLAGKLYALAEKYWRHLQDQGALLKTLNLKPYILADCCCCC